MRELLIQLHREFETGRRARGPASRHVGPRLSVEGGIDFDGVEVLRIERQLVEPLAASAGTRTAQLQLGLDLTQVNADRTTALPMPTVIVADAAGVIRWIDVHPDYTTRTEAGQILQAITHGRLHVFIFRGGFLDVVDLFWIEVDGEDAVCLCLCRPG